MTGCTSLVLPPSAPSGCRCEGLRAHRSRDKGRKTFPLVEQRDAMRGARVDMERGRAVACGPAGVYTAPDAALQVPFKVASPPCRHRSPGRGLSPGHSPGHSGRSPSSDAACPYDYWATYSVCSPGKGGGRVKRLLEVPPSTGRALPRQGSGRGEKRKLAIIMGVRLGGGGVEGRLPRDESDCCGAVPGLNKLSSAWQACGLWAFARRK